jgi:hypothetical protein
MKSIVEEIRKRANDKLESLGCSHVNIIKYRSLITISFVKNIDGMNYYFQLKPPAMPISKSFTFPDESDEYKKEAIDKIWENIECQIDNLDITKYLKEIGWLNLEGKNYGYLRG